ncbi:Ig-like domain-containing protein [Chimaeribacter arupi]|uniref:Ig-like domain-containing protein n=1 Tax=Chimaeribacter arupi TaxID=2060066 RepID=UPI0013FD06F5|nr:Ig-like domain-containing protein [Chimaeribacter arupi]
MTRTFSLSRYHSTLTSPRIDDTPVIALAGSLNSAAASHTPAPETDIPQADAGQATTATEAQAVAPTLTIYPFAGDNILNGVEGETEQIIRGMTTGIAAGRVVNITVGDYAHATATVQADGSWSAAIHPSDMYYVFRYNGSGIVASVSNADGTNAYASSPLTVNYGWPSLTLHAFTGDDIVSGQEGQAAQRLSGSAGFVEPGQIVTVTLNEKTYTAQVGTDGNWYIDIPAADMATLPDGAEITATVSNARGQQAGDSATLTVNSSLPSLTLNAFATDNVLSDAEAFRSPALSGTTTGVEAGQTVTITLNGKTYTTLVAADGSFSAAIPAADLLRLYNGEAEISATATNQAGETTRDSQFFTAVYTTPRIIVNPVTGDNYINGLEVGSVEISGSAPSIAGSVINLTFVNRSFSTQVEADGTWRIPIEGMFMYGLPDGQYTLTVDAPGSAPVSVDVGLYASPLNNFPMRIDTPFGDGVLTSAEAAQAQTLTGSTGVTGAGQRVELSIGEWRYETTAAANGEWVVTVPAGALQEISGTSERISVVAYDFVGNYDYEDKRFEVAFGDANLTMKPVAGDNIINAAEAAAGIVLSGTANASAAGLTLTVTLNGVVHRTTITSNGSWSVPITTAELVSLPDGIVTATVALPGSAPVNIDVNVAIQASPAPVFDTPFGDSVLTAEEAATDQLLTGTTGVTGSGQSVVITLNGKTYAATVDDSGHWQAILPSSVLQALPEGGATLKVIATDAAGYSGSDTLTILVDQIVAPITIYPVTGDNLVNFDEALDGITLGGITDGLPTGTVLTLTLAGNTYTTTTGTDGSWTYDVSQHDVFNSWWQASPLTLTVTAPDGQSASTVIGNYIDNRADATFNQPFGDGILTLAEAATDQVLTGKTGMRGAGQTVVVTLESEPLGNGNVASFSGSVDENGNWQVTLPSAALQALTGSWAYMLATVTDIAGNSGTAEQIPTLALTPPTLTIHPFTGDNDLSFAEREQDQTLSGTLYSNDGEGVAGLTVTISMRWGENGEFTYTALTDAGGKWQVTVPATDLAQLPYGWASLSGTVTDDAGNIIRSGSQFMVSLPVAGITLDPIAGDNVLTGNELGEELVVSGSSEFLLMPLSLRVTINGITHRYDGTGPDWAVTFTRQELAQFPDGPLVVTVTSYDPYFNEVTTTATLYVDLNNLPSLTLDPIAGDNIINAAEAAAGVVLSGQSSEAGGVVSVQLNGVTYEAGVDEEGSWQLALPNSALAELEDGRYTLTLSQTGFNGQTTTVTESLLLDADPANRPVLRIHTISHDNVLNGAELQSDQIITGSSENVESGQTLSLKIGGVTYTTQVQPGGGWSLIVPAEDLAALGDGGETLRAGVTDASGNRATASRNLTIKSDRDGLSIDPVTGDNLINAADAEGAITLTGHTDGVRHGAMVRLTLNGEHYTAKVGKDGSWSAKVPAADVAALEEGSATLTACVKSACGQMLYAKAELTVDTRAPELALTAVTGDNLISLQEAQAGFALTGSAGIAAAGLLVLVVLNGVEYHGAVQAGGDWTVAIPAGTLADQPAGDYPLTVSLTDTAGNLTSLTSVVTLEAAPDADATETAALTVTSQTVAAESADSTLTSALAVPDTATDTADGTYAIGGQTLTLAEPGAEALGGSGNDTILLNTLDFLHIDGGSGTDTLLLAGSDQHLDLTALGLKIENIDIFDLGNGSNSLTLGLHEAETVRDTPEENLFIRGADGSQLVLTGDNTWETHGQREVGGLLFDVYHATGLESADLLVQQGILVQQG